MRTDLCKMGAKLHVNPAATQCGRKTAYLLDSRTSMLKGLPGRAIG